MRCVIWNSTFVLLLLSERSTFELPNSWNQHSVNPLWLVQKDKLNMLTFIGDSPFKVWFRPLNNNIHPAEVMQATEDFFEATQLSKSNWKILPFPSYHWTLVHSSFPSMSKGQWGNREYYDAATATSPAAAAVRQVKFGMKMDGMFWFFQLLSSKLSGVGAYCLKSLEIHGFERAKRFIGTGVWAEFWNDKTSSKIPFFRHLMVSDLFHMAMARSMHTWTAWLVLYQAVWKLSRWVEVFLPTALLVHQQCGNQLEETTCCEGLKVGNKATWQDEVKDTPNSHDFSLFSICFQVSLFYRYDSARNDAKFVLILFLVLEVKTSDRGIPRLVTDLVTRRSLGERQALSSHLGRCRTSAKRPHAGPMGRRSHFRSLRAKGSLTWIYNHIIYIRLYT